MPEAARWLKPRVTFVRMYSVDAPRRARQSRRIEDMYQTLGMALHRGQLVLRVGAAGIIAEAVLRVG